ncbi:MAG: hypothetical protein ACHQNV_07185 [Vicinamibacteria bacterium]
MITLTGQREIAGCNVYRDDSDALAFYLMPQSPRIALDDTGKPIFSLVWYRRDVSKLTDDERKTKLGGGILSVSVELSTTDDQMAQLRDGLSGDAALQAATGLDKGKLAAALKIGTVPITDGTVTIAILAETSGEGGGMGEFVANLVGVGRVSMTGKERASFMAKLTQDGVVLLWDMVEKNLPAIRVGYDLKFNYRLDAVRMDVWCDASKAYNACQEMKDTATENASWSETHTDSSDTYTYGDDQSKTARNALWSRVSGHEWAGVVVTPEAGPDAVKPEEIQQLTQFGNEMIKDFLAATFLEYKPTELKPDEEPDLKTELASQNGKKYGHDGIDQYTLKTWDESMSASLRYTFTSKAVLEGHLAPNDNLGNLLRGQPVAQFRTRIDIDAAYYKYLDLEVLCTADFDDDPISLVRAHVEYKGNGPEGPIDSVGGWPFQKGTPPQRFATYLAGPDQLSYAYRYDVFYKGTSATFSVSGQGDDTILVLDVDRLGVLRVDFQMGVIDWNEIRQVLVTASYGAGTDRKSTQFTLDKDHESYRWIEVIAKAVTEPYQYQATFIDKNNQQIPLPPKTDSSKVAVISQPLQQSMAVLFVSVGAYGPGGLISQVVVAARYRDTKNNYNADDLYTLVKEGDKAIWSVPLRDPTFRQYEFKCTVMYSDGVTREDDWKTSDSAIQPVGDPYGFRVSIIPYLLKKAVWQFGVVDLNYDDPPSSIHVDNSIRVEDFTQPLTWRFRLGAPERHGYTYQLTLYRASDGKDFKLPPQTDSKEVLVLVPPATT